jgi:hypothetical protein
VKLTNNCGKSYHIIFRSGGAELSTTSSGIGTDSLYEYEEFSPQNCEEWRHVVLDLSSYAGQYVTISFLNKSGYGNNMYLDNIVFEGKTVEVTNTSPNYSIALQPNPAKDNITLSGEIESGQELIMQVFAMTGEKMAEKKMIVPPGAWNEHMNLRGLPAGTYVVKVTSDQNLIWTEKLIKIQ